MDKTFLNEVRGKRAAKHLTQEDVAKAIGISRRAYISFEQGQQNNFKERETLIKLCELLEINQPPAEEKSLKYKPKMTCEVSPETQIYKGLILAGLAEPGDKVTLIIERAQS